MIPVRIRWKDDRDGLGFFYGTYIGRETVSRVDLMPPDPGPMSGADLPIKADPGLWIAYVDGVEVARAPSREAAEAALQSLLCGGSAAAKGR